MKRGNRYAAAQDGVRFYASEVPCNKGHMSLRSTTNGACMECKRVQEKQRIALNRVAYNLRKKKERSLKLPLIAAAAKMQRLKETPEKRANRLEGAKIASALWRKENPKHVGTQIAKKKYKQQNHGQVVAGTAKRRASKIKRTPKWVGSEEQWLIRQTYELAALRTKVFGFSWHVDHIVPLQGDLVSGLHTPWNLRVIPGVVNVAKSNKYVPA